MPKNKFMMIGKGKVVHVVTTKANDLKNAGKGSQCQAVRSGWTAGRIKGKGVSPEAALALDECKRCGSHVVATAEVKASETPEQKRARSKEARDEVLERAKGGKKKSVKASKPSKSKGKVKDTKPSKTKAGVRSTASAKDGDPAEAKAKMLHEHALASGWKSTVTKDKKTGHVVVTATRGAETIMAWYIDGKYDINRHAEVRVGDWVGKLRGAHAARRQMSLEGRDRPHPEPGKGRSGPRASKKDEVVPEDESPEDAAKRVPFLLDDDDIAIIDEIAGKTIRWRNGVSKKTEEAIVPSKSKRTRIDDHPKKPGRRILTFMEVVGNDSGREQFGPERSVALDAIVRVVG
jgi:hypothetical protein